MSNVDFLVMSYITRTAERMCKLQMMKDTFEDCGDGTGRSVNERDWEACCDNLGYVLVQAGVGMCHVKNLGLLPDEEKACLEALSAHWAARVPAPKLTEEEKSEGWVPFGMEGI